MNLCMEGHQEIAFVGRSKDCPLCDALATVNELEERLAEQEKSAASYISDLEAQLRDSK